MQSTPETPQKILMSANQLIVDINAMTNAIDKLHTTIVSIQSKIIASNIPIDFQPLSNDLSTLSTTHRSTLNNIWAVRNLANQLTGMNIQPGSGGGKKRRSRKMTRRRRR
jgi:hypothetical protein